MHTVVIIGGGNVGSRHMQSFALSYIPIRLIVIDPALSAIDVCKSRWQEANPSGNNKKVKISFQYDYMGLPEKITLAIIATNSLQRYDALEMLLKKYKCDYIILEKFLFSSEGEYAMAESLIMNYGCKVFVNCMKRIYECYLWVFKKLNVENSPRLIHPLADGILNIKVTGNNWGMGSNSIHFMDLFCYLANDVINYCEFNLPDITKIIDSKREGYLELIGNLEVKSLKGHKLQIECNEGDPDGIFIRIDKGDLCILIVEKNDTIKMEIPRESIAKEFNYPHQSQLTLKCFEQIISEDECLLPKYDEVVNSHVKFLQAVKKIMAHKKYEKEWSIT